VIIATTREDGTVESRVAMTPETVKKFAALGAKVTVETGAGANSGFPDADYEAAGATIARSAAEAHSDADVVLKLRRPGASELPLIK
jgi:proton-translocating NAD(P)+ transhydrogenase subunit alpha